MSDRSVSITIGTTGSIRHVNGVRLAGTESKDKMYEPKQSKKMVRVLTVIAYMFTVSFAAIMLSVYYVFLWQPAEKRHYMDMTPHSLKGGATKCPPPLDTAHAPTIAASANEFPTTPREEATTKRPDALLTSRPMNEPADMLATRGLERLIHPSPLSDDTQEEDT